MKRPILIFLAALMAAVGFAAPSQAGGLGNYYNKGDCSSGSGVFVVTNYDSDNYNTQTYHFSASGNLRKVQFDYYTWPIYSNEIYDALSHWGYTEDGFQKFDITGRDHYVRAYWESGASCGFTI